MTPLNSSFKITSSSLEFSSQKNPLSGCWGTKEPVYFSSLRHSANYTTFVSLFPLATPSPCDSHPNMNVKGYPWLACFPSPLFLFLDAYFFFFFFFFWLHHAARGILVSRQGIKPELPAVEAQSLDRWATREVPSGWLFLVARCSLVSMQV